MKKSLVIAQQTVQGYFRDRLFHAVLVFAVLLLGFSLFLSTLTTVEPRKVLLDFGLASVSLIGVGFALLVGSTIIRKEMEQRTIYTIFAKPVGRSEYLVGKFIGGSFVLVVVHAVCGGVLAAVILAMGEAVPTAFWGALYLSSLEALLVLALAVMLSLWCSSLFLGAALSLAGFLVGRSNYSFRVLSEKAETPAVKSVMRFLHDVSPSLQRFDVRDLAAYDKPFPDGIVGTSSLYFVAYLLLLLTVSALIFRRKDLP